MGQKNEKINAKIKHLGQIMGLDESTSLNAKRTMKNVITMAIFTGVFVVLGFFLLPGGLAGNYYGGGGIRDFQLFFRGLL